MQICIWLGAKSKQQSCLRRHVSKLAKAGAIKIHPTWVFCCCLTHFSAGKYYWCASCVWLVYPYSNIKFISLACSVETSLAKSHFDALKQELGRLFSVFLLRCSSIPGKVNRLVQFIKVSLFKEWGDFHCHENCETSLCATLPSGLSHLTESKACTEFHL